MATSPAHAPSIRARFSSVTADWLEHDARIYFDCDLPPMLSEPSRTRRIALLRDIRLEAQRAMPWVMAFLLIVWSLGDPSTRAEIHASALSFDQDTAALAPADTLESIQ